MKKVRTRKTIIRTWETLMHRYTELDDAEEVERLIVFEQRNYKRATIVNRLRARWLMLKREELRREAETL